MPNILLVEDSPEAFNLVKLAVSQSSYLDWVKTLREAIVAIQKKAFDLILLDLMLPDGEGYQLCSQMQNEVNLRKIPVFFLSARSSVSDKVMGFSVGADDFVSKPFEPIELRARIEARLRKLDRERTEQDHLRLGEIEIDRLTQRVSVFEDGQQNDIELTPIEFKLLLFLVRKPNHVFAREEVLNSVWGQDVYVYPRSVDTHVSKLRKKLGRCSSYIQSVHGSGYRFEIDDRRPRQIHLEAKDLLFASGINNLN